MAVLNVHVHQKLGLHAGNVWQQGLAPANSQLVFLVVDSVQLLHENHIANLEASVSSHTGAGYVFLETSYWLKLKGASATGTVQDALGPTSILERTLLFWPAIPIPSQTLPIAPKSLVMAQQRSIGNGTTPEAVSSTVGQSSMVFRA